MERLKLMNVEQPWDMLADKKIWAMLGNPDSELTNDHIRLMLIEIFSRLKTVEMENHTLKVLLFLYEYLDEKTFSKALEATREFFQNRDEEKAKEVEFFANSGISFVDWVSFATKGTFEKDAH
jgi:hypothetical protein